MLTATRTYIDGLVTALTAETGIKLVEGQNWSADVKARKLIYPVLELTQLSPSAVKGLLLHETGHLLYTEAKENTELETKMPVMHNVYNAYEDIRIEHKLGEKYGDFARMPLTAVKKMVASHMPQQLNPDPKPSNILNQLLVMNIYQASDWINSQPVNPNLVIDKMSLKAQQFFNNNFDKLHAINQEIAKAKDLKELQNIVDTKAYPILKELIEKIDEKEQQQMVSEATAKQENPEKGLAGFCENFEYNEELPTDQELKGIIAPYASTLARQLDQVLKELRATRYTGLHKTGKLLNPNVYKVLTGENRIFSRKNNPNKADYNFIVCLDASGSMVGKKFVNTYIGAFLLKTVFDKLKFTYKFIKFENSVSVSDNLKAYRNFNGGGNNDRRALLVAKDYIRKDKENILLMLSDGSICTKVSDVVEEILKTNTLIIGVGIGTDNQELKEHYKQAIGVPDVSKLPNALIGLLKLLIHR